MPLPSHPPPFRSNLVVPATQHSLPFHSTLSSLSLSPSTPQSPHQLRGPATLSSVDLFLSPHHPHLSLCTLLHLAARTKHCSRKSRCPFNLTTPPTSPSLPLSSLRPHKSLFPRNSLSKLPFHRNASGTSHPPRTFTSHRWHNKPFSCTTLPHPPPFTSPVSPSPYVPSISPLLQFPSFLPHHPTPRITHVPLSHHLSPPPPITTHRPKDPCTATPSHPSISSSIQSLSINPSPQPPPETNISLPPPHPLMS